MSITINNKQSILPAKHVGSFLLLIFLATFRPSAIWPNFPFSLEPIAVLAIGFLLFYKIYSTIGFKSFWQKYKIELLLLSAYFGVCFFSLYLNTHRYANAQELTRYGVTFIVITMSFPAAIFLFILPLNEKGPSLSRFKFSGYLPWLYFALLALLAIWQYIDFESAKGIGNFFVSSEVWPSRNVNSFFRIRTDFGAVLGVLTATILIGLLFPYSSLSEEPQYKALVILLVVFIVAGSLCGSRTFLLLIGCSLLGAGLFFIKSKPFKTALVLIITILIFHLFVFYGHDYLAIKLGKFFPYILSVKNGDPFIFTELVPVITSESFGLRSVLWQRAITMLENNWWFGISNGGFRLNGVSDYMNTHSILLQPLVNSGLIGTIFLLLLIAKTLKRIDLTNPIIICIISSVFISLLVDYYPDHSLPWIISISYITAYFSLEHWQRSYYV